MSDTTALATFFTTWAMPSADERAAILSGVLAADARYSDPNSPMVMAGADAINEMIGHFSANMPGGAAWVTRQSDAKNGFSRARVAFGKDGNAMMEGRYFCETDSDGKLTLIVGFIGSDGA